MKKEKGGGKRNKQLPISGKLLERKSQKPQCLLLAQAESLHNGTIAVNVLVVEILQHLAATTHELGQRAGCTIVLVVLLQVLSQVLDAVAEQCNLALGRTCIGDRLAVLLEDLFFLGFV